MNDVRVDKQEFHESIMDMQKDPNNPLVQKEYIRQLTRLSTLLMRKYRVTPSEQEDYKQDMMEIAFRRNLHGRIDPNQNSFAFYYSTIMREIWKKNNKRWKKIDHIQRNGIYDTMGDDNTGAEDMLKKLDFSLEDYDPQDLQTVEDIYNLPEVKVASKSVRSKARHWEVMFTELRDNRTMLESDLVKLLPDNKQLKNPTMSLTKHMKEIAEREGYKLSVRSDNDDKIYVLKGS